MQETRIKSLNQEDPLEKGTVTPFSILAWRIHGWRSLVGYSPWDLKELNTTNAFFFFIFSLDFKGYPKSKVNSSQDT